MWVIVSCHPWTGVVGRMQDAFFPSSPMIPEGLRVSTCIAPPLSWDAWHCLIYKNRVSHAPNPSKSNIKSHAVHLDIPILACTAWMLNNKKQLISWSFLFLSCVFPTLKMFIRFPKKLFGTVFFCSDAVDHLLWGVLRIAQASRVVELLTSWIYQHNFPPGWWRVNIPSRNPYKRISSHRKVGNLTCI